MVDAKHDKKDRELGCPQKCETAGVSAFVVRVNGSKLQGSNPCPPPNLKGVIPLAVTDKLKAIYGIREFIRRYHIDIKVNSDHQINTLFMHYFECRGRISEFIPQTGHGRYKAAWDNAVTIQEDFDDFRKWIQANYKKKENKG